MMFPLTKKFQGILAYNVAIMGRNNIVLEAHIQPLGFHTI